MTVRLSEGRTIMTVRLSEGSLSENAREKYDNTGCFFFLTDRL